MAIYIAVVNKRNLSFLTKCGIIEIRMQIFNRNFKEDLKNKKRKLYTIIYNNKDNKQIYFSVK